MFKYIAVKQLMEITALQYIYIYKISFHILNYHTISRICLLTFLDAFDRIVLN